MVELSELSYYRYCRITVCYLIGRRSGHQNMVELSIRFYVKLLQDIHSILIYMLGNVMKKSLLIKGKPMM
ncbi:hypothetical protein LAZ67_6002168 [Cordylochernes scorpioides]|uniref:Uncharacterized protein n=1 Tax=Cordylochernes scorpioides TaxID=51811 RepID=A0ABY6KML5_9ARAC|nr:hypothetical protein LAZ67_6002168 [Cordylochernes scorpioides]